MFYKSRSATFGTPVYVGAQCIVIITPQTWTEFQKLQEIVNAYNCRDLFANLYLNPLGAPDAVYLDLQRVSLFWPAEKRRCGFLKMRTSHQDTCLTWPARHPRSRQGSAWESQAGRGPVCWPPRIASACWSDWSELDRKWKKSRSVLWLFGRWRNVRKIW